ncbi:peroxidase 57-like [Cucurbita moschata]|uniref:Peroxidase n=1 Tax=Cucurbita moschata TaxID=3662 RepID=A0A6J1G1V0_CUCMO|nr:peroxidase 57-like [Cucurbita moschata]
MEVGRVGQVTCAAFLIACCLTVRTCSAVGKNKGRNLRAGFYQYTCPQAEKIAADLTSAALGQDPTLAASLLRLFFHDCFVNGCDASILLDSTLSGEPIEKASLGNGKTMRGFELIDEIKAKLENECPEVVSCADITAYITRDATVFSGLPYFKIPAGRRDSVISRAADVFHNLPTPAMTVDEMAAIFTRKGMTVDEMVTLTGAHSIGKVQCSVFEDRIYNYSETGSRDPKLQAAYASYLSAMCPPADAVPADLAAEGGDRLVYLDPSSPFRLDNSFYLRMREGKTLLQSDQNMADDPRTAELVGKMAAEPKMWMKKFTRALVRLSRVDVLTGNAGEIRKNCRAVNL